MMQTFQIGDMPAIKYQIQAELGHDMFGASYLAQELASGALVTLTMIPKQVSSNKNEFYNFKRNFSILQRFDHKNITKAYTLDFDNATGNHFMVMEYMNGMNLRAMRMTRERGVLPIPEAVEVCHQIAEALDFAHHSLLHRNLRPQNVWITTDNTVKLIGFDLLSEQLSMEIRNKYLQKYPNEAFHIHNYMAPEQFFDFMPHGPAADHYALATLFYEMITGQPPFNTTDTRKLMYAVCNVTPHPVESLGKKRNQILIQGMSKDPGERFPTAMDFVNTMGYATFSLSQLPNKWVSASAGFLVTASMIWFIIMTPPITAFSSLPPLPNLTASVTKSPPVIETAANGPVVLPPPPVVPTSMALPTQITEPQMAKAETLLLRVETRPPGATLFLDGKRLGNTPFSVNWVKVGNHALRLEKEDFSPIEVNLEFSKNTVVDLTLNSLKPSSPLSAALQTHPKEQILALEKQIESLTMKDAEGTKASELEKKTQQEIATLLTVANQHFKADRLTKPVDKNALDAYQKILKLTPKHLEAQQGINRIIERLLALGQEDLDNWRLTSPLEGNALEKFHTVLTIDDKNPTAQAGLKELVDRFLSLAKQFASDTQKAHNYLDQAEAILPGASGIAQTRAAIFHVSE